LRPHRRRQTHILGVVYTEFDEHGAWKQALIKELLAADYEVEQP
jgi:hypothetical protein